MDDFNVSSLSEAKGEYTIRLINILTPVILEGIKSIYDNSKKLCVQNDEYDKYLMTFQNLLSRVVNWNENLIQNEVDRIVRRTKCSYINELICSVHVANIKILSSVNLGDKCRKISFKTPSINSFIHNVYKNVARKLYTCVYLFEAHLPSLTEQKYMRECELLIQKCIQDTIRDSVPVENILRNYLENSLLTIEEEIQQENDSCSADVSVDVCNNEVKPDDATKSVEVKPDDATKSVEVKPDDATKSIEVKPDDATKSVEVKPDDATKSVEVKPDDATKSVEVKPDDATKSVEVKPDDATKSVEVNTEVSVKKSNNSQTLNFNNEDKVLYMDTNKEGVETAPKDVATLENISDIRYQERKLEEQEDADEDDDKIKILDESPNISDNITELKSDNNSLLNDVIVLT
jgi:hypothetical protein